MTRRFSHRLPHLALSAVLSVSILSCTDTESPPPSFASGSNTDDRDTVDTQADTADSGTEPREALTADDRIAVPTWSTLTILDGLGNVVTSTTFPELDPEGCPIVCQGYGVGRLNGETFVSFDGGVDPDKNINGRIGQVELNDDKLELLWSTGGLLWPHDVEADPLGRGYAVAQSSFQEVTWVDEQGETLGALSAAVSGWEGGYHPNAIQLIEHEGSVFALVTWRGRTREGNPEPALGEFGLFDVTDLDAPEGIWLHGRKEPILYAHGAYVIPWEDGWLFTVGLVDNQAEGAIRFAYSSDLWEEPEDLMDLYASEDRPWGFPRRAEIVGNQILVADTQSTAPVAAGGAITPGGVYIGTLPEIPEPTDPIPHVRLEDMKRLGPILDAPFEVVVF